MTLPAARFLAPGLAVLCFTLTGLAIGGCASVKPVHYDSAAVPADEINKMDQDVADGYEKHYDVLDQKDFDKAQKNLAEAKRHASKGADNEKVLSDLGYARAYLNRAKEKSDSLQGRFAGILDARSAALKAGVRKYPDIEKGFKNADDDVRSEIKPMENGKTTPRRWAKLQKQYLDLELRAIQATKLADANAKVSWSLRNGARKNCPNMLGQAQRDIENARGVIAANRHDDQAIEPAIQRANATAQLLTEVLAATKRPEGVINEDAALAMVRQARHIKDLNSKLGTATSEATQSAQQLTEQKQKVEAANKVLSLDQALDDARHQLGPDEAEVYRQGNNLLLRLKAIDFPSGKSDLPEKSLPLLGKVKSIAEELNPSHILIEGHTDSTGSRSTNMALSQDRADAVATYLESNGVEGEKVEAIGRGDKKPVTTNKTKEGRAQNRRVDVIITPSTQETKAM